MINRKQEFNDYLGNLMQHNKSHHALFNTHKI